MDPSNIATAVAHTTTCAYTLGQIIFDDLYQGFNEAGREYDTFSVQLKQLGACLMIVRPFLLNPNCPFSEYILRHLHRVVQDTHAILADLQQAVDRLRNGTERHERIISIGFFRFSSSRENERRKRLQRFIKRPRIDLQRCQIVYAKTVLEIIVAVVQYAQAREPQQAQVRLIYNEDALIREAHSARRRVDRLERTPEGWGVRATCWINIMPSSQNGHQSPFDTLANQWTRAIQQGPPAQILNREQVRAWVEEMNADLRNRMRALDHEVTRLNRLRRQDADGYAAREQTLQAEIMELTRARAVQDGEIHQLRLQRNGSDSPQNDPWAGLHRVEQERNQALRELDQLRERLRPASGPMPPNSYLSRGRKPRRSSRSTDSSRTYVIDAPESSTRASSRSSSRHSSGHSGRGNEIAYERDDATYYSQTVQGRQGGNGRGRRLRQEVGVFA